MAMQQGDVMQLSREDMTPVLQNVGTSASDGTGDGDIPISEVNMTGNAGGGDGFSPGMEAFPQVLPSNPTFTVPANPLLPDEYSEVLDYNSVQYLNGIFRTQIGRYVRVQQLVGSNMIEDYDGFLIGVGINYIILQEYSSANIRILDIYGIKNMYVYYADMENPYMRMDRGN